MKTSSSAGLSRGGVSPGPCWPRSMAFVCAGLGYYAGVLTGRPSVVPPGRLPGEPTLVIAPFADLGDGPQAARYAAGLTEELLTALPRFKEITVFGRETSKALPPGVEASQVREGLGARYLLAGGVRVAGDKIRVTVRLVDTSEGSILWSQHYDENLDTHELFLFRRMSRARWRRRSPSLTASSRNRWRPIRRRTMMASMTARCASTPTARS